MRCLYNSTSVELETLQKAGCVDHRWCEAYLRHSGVHQKINSFSQFESPCEQRYTIQIIHASTHSFKEHEIIHVNGKLNRF